MTDETITAGTLALVRDPPETDVGPYYDGHFTGISVTGTHTYLDHLVVQHGRVAGRVPTRDERISIDADGDGPGDTHSVDIELWDDTTVKRVGGAWVGDVCGTGEEPTDGDDPASLGAGWILAESTHASGEDYQGDWPWHVFQTALGREVEPAHVDPAAFFNRLGRGDDLKTEMVTKSSVNGDTTVEWGTGATKSMAAKADVGIAWKTRWNGEQFRGVIYASGYMSLWQPDELGVELLGRFITDQVLPCAYVPEEDEDDATEQETLDDAEEVTAG